MYGLTQLVFNSRTRQFQRINTLTTNPILYGHARCTVQGGTLTRFFHLLFIGFAPSDCHNNSLTQQLPRGILERHGSLCRRSDNSSVLNHGVLGNDNNSIANEIGTVVRVHIDQFCFVDESAVTANASVLVDDGAIYDGSFTYSHAWLTSNKIFAHFFKRLIVIGSHQVR